MTSITSVVLIKEHIQTRYNMHFAVTFASVESLNDFIAELGDVIEAICANEAANDK